MTLLRLLPLTLLALASSAPAARTQSSSGTLDPSGIAIDNGIVRFHFFQPAGGDVELDVTDVVAGHAFAHRGAGLWGIEALDTANPGYGSASIESIAPGDCSPNVQWVLTLVPGQRTLALQWAACSTAALGTDSCSVELTLMLADGSPTAAWTLSATSGMSQWSFWSGRIHLSIEEDPARTHWFLDPIGYLTEDPAVNLPTWSLGTPQAQTGTVENFKHPILHVVSQLAAYYDDEGNGLYFAGADPTGSQAKTGFFKSVPPQGSELPRLDYECAWYAGDVFAPASALAGPAMEIGVFQGDWYDAADRYRRWLDASPIGAQGPVALRQDVAAHSKTLQQVFVLSPHENLGAVGSEPKSVPDRILDYGNHHGLSELTCVVFGNSWSVGDACGNGEYDFDDAPGSPWPNNVAIMQAAGIPLYLYMLDVAYAFDPFGPSSGMCAGACTLNDTYWLQGWDQRAVIGIGGTPLQFGDCAGGIYPPTTMIDGTTNAWQRHMEDVGFELASLGVAGVYVDNVLPGYFEGCYSSAHPHPPGLGTAHVEGLTASLASLHAGGVRAAGEFEVATEGGQYESYVPYTGNIGGEGAFGDFLGGIQATRRVPSGAVSYHHLALSTVVRCDYPFLAFPALLPPELPAKDNVWLSDPLEVESGRRGAMHAAASAIVNGAPLWVPDQAQNSPKGPLPFSFETTEPAAATYQACIDYAAAGSRYRGTTAAQPFLNVGERLRDLVFEDPVPEIIVPLPTLAYSTVPAENASQKKPVPALLHSVWRDVQTDDVGVCFANHSSTALSGVSYSFDPAAYGLSPTTGYQIFLVTPGQPDQLVLAATGTIAVTLPTLPAESFHFYRVAQP